MLFINNFYTIKRLCFKTNKTPDPVFIKENIEILIN